jgi:hypothetical protein
MKSKPVPLVRFRGELAAYHTAETDYHQILNLRLVAEKLVTEVTANNKELCVTGIRFKYWLVPVYSWTICRRRCPDFWKS